MCYLYLVILSGFYVFFFFQAEDGIRDRNVTGVQTCALPISGDADPGSDRCVGPLFLAPQAPAQNRTGAPVRLPARSEERRVGKECRCRGSAEHEEKKEID